MHPLPFGCISLLAGSWPSPRRNTLSRPDRSCFTLFDAVARLLTSGGREDAGPVRSYTSKRAKTADPGAISSTSYPPAAGIDLPQPTPAPTAGGGNENPFFGGGAGGRL